MNKKSAIEVSPLVSIVNESGLDKTKAQYLLDNFSKYFKLASEWEARAKTIKVTSADQTFDMKVAREGRKFLRDRRTDIEKARVSLKADALREGQTIDAIAKILKNLIVPIEEYLDVQEHFIEIQEQKAIDERTAKRVEELSQYDFIDSVSIDPSIDVRTATDDQFKEYIGKLEAKKQEKIAEAKRIEQERIDAEKKRQEELKKAQERTKQLQKESELKEQRGKLLAEAGFKFDGYCWRYDELTFSLSEIATTDKQEEKLLLKQIAIDAKTIKDREVIKEKTRKNEEALKEKARKEAEAKAQKEKEDLERKLREEKVRNELKLQQARQEEMKNKRKLELLQKAFSQFQIFLVEGDVYTFKFNEVTGSGKDLDEAVLNFCKEYIKKV